MAEQVDGWTLAFSPTLIDFDISIIKPSNESFMQRKTKWSLNF